MGLGRFLFSWLAFQYPALPVAPSYLAPFLFLGMQEAGRFFLVKMEFYFPALKKHFFSFNDFP